MLIFLFGKICTVSQSSDSSARESPHPYVEETGRERYIFLNVAGRA